MFIIESPDEARGSDSFSMIRNSGKNTANSKPALLKASQKQEQTFEKGSPSSDN